VAETFVVALKEPRSLNALGLQLGLLSRYTHIYTYLTLFIYTKHILKPSLSMLSRYHMSYVACIAIIDTFILTNYTNDAYLSDTSVSAASLCRTDSSCACWQTRP
jgi:hypothetical protein